MVRVIRPNGGEEEYDANQVAVGPSGALELNRVDFQDRWNPQTGRTETMISNAQLVVKIAPGQWVRVENMDLEAADAEPERSPLEVAR